jgi:hypothetical protein
MVQMNSIIAQDLGQSKLENLELAGFAFRQLTHEEATFAFPPSLRNVKMKVALGISLVLQALFAILKHLISIAYASNRYYSDAFDDAWVE